MKLAHAAGAVRRPRLGALVLCALGAGLATTVASNDAAACGGCFPPPPEVTRMPSVVASHRMVLSISATQTVLWDQVQYAGDAPDFAWVLPVKPGAYLEVGTDAWFETLDAATAPRVTSPRLACPPMGGPSSGGTYGSSSGNGNGNGNADGSGQFVDFGEGSEDTSGCNCGPGCAASDDFGSAAELGGTATSSTSGVSTWTTTSATGAGGGPVEPPPVAVVHEGTAGPYETVTLHANQQGVLAQWLADNGYAIDPDIQPIVDAYTAEGFDFIALRLAPDEGVRQMRPVRVIAPGASPALPLRMVAAGTGANVGITLFVIGEGRWETANFPNTTIGADELSWDFATSKSTYAELRASKLAAASGRTWLTSYAELGALLSPLPHLDGFVEYTVADGTVVPTIASAYFLQGTLNAEGDPAYDPYACSAWVEGLAASGDEVVDPCAPPPGGAGGGGAGPGGSGPGGGGGAPSGGGGAGGAADCTAVGAGQIDVAAMSCGPLDDLGVALVGMHPKDVWVTRLESDLPRAALADDLTMQAAADQSIVDNWLVPKQAANAPCPLAVAPVTPLTSGPRAHRGWPRGPRSSKSPVQWVLGLAAVALGYARRSRRRSGSREARAAG